MLRKPLMVVDAVFCAADRQIENHAQRGVRPGHSKGRGRAAPHAAAKDVRALDVQMI
jgi:hypothetical protein